MPHSTGCFALFALPALTALAACHHPKTPTEGDKITESFGNPKIMAGPGQHTVLIRDGGFDLNNHVLQGKIGGAYHVHCTDAPEPEGATDAIQAREQLIKSLQTKDTSCHLLEGLDLVRSSKFDEIASSRDLWNERISSRKSAADVPLVSEIPTILEGEESFDYHGTYVASVIAYENPNVKLVLIADESIARADYTPSCPSQDDLDLTISLFQDADVKSAYLAAPSDSLTDEVAARTKEHGVTLSNESFGSLSVTGMNHFCPGLDWKHFYQVTGDLQSARAEALAQRGEFGGISVLTLRAAGNEGVTIDSVDDSPSCALGPDSLGGASATLMVGSYNPENQTLSAFSDRGACVEVAAPGEDIVLAAPHNFLFVASGTSFAAPLTTRLASLTFAPGTAPSEMKSKLLDQRVDPLSLPASAFPSELYYKSPGDGAPAVKLGLASISSPVARRAPVATMRELQRRFLPR